MSLKTFRIFYCHHLNVIPLSVVNMVALFGGVDCTYRICGVLCSQSDVVQKCIQYAAFGG